MRALAAAGLCVLLAACAGAPRGGGWVEAEGWAPAGPGAGQRALDDALRRALERAAGVSLNARTEVSRGLAGESRLRSASRGRIARYDVVSRQETSSGAVVTVRALVEPGAAGPGPDLPLISVECPGDEDACAALGQGLLAAGFTLVERDAKLILRGRSRCRPVIDRRLGRLSSYSAWMDLEAREPATGLILWRGQEEAAALEAAPLSARRKALTEAGGRLARAAARELPEALWKRS